MTTLVTGGTGTTGSRLARLLHDAGYPSLLASRSGSASEPFKGVHFDWLDKATHENPFKADAGITRIYLIPPVVVDMLSAMKDFIDLAISKGVRRFVLLSATLFEKGDPLAGRVHEYLADRGVEYYVLRPTWFMDNLSTQFLRSIRDQNEIFSVAKDGRIPFISADNIAQIAFNALVGPALNTDHCILGPELFSYDEVAVVLSEALGRKITHKRLTEEESLKFWSSVGLPDDYALLLMKAEKEIANGSQEAVFHSHNKVLGKEHLRDYVTSHRHLWLPQ